MKVALAFLSIIAAASAWVLPKQLQQAAGAAAIVGALAISQPAFAVDFAGSFADPKHPNCQRVISADGPKAFIKGTDGTPGCPADGSGREWKLTGKIDGESIFVDFSPKGGPADLKGIWDASSPPGIKWPDGNKWTLQSSP